ncbi:PIN domain-containing protein [Methylobacterium frigidaeris]|uniref:Ribonuclease VapC n=1 Tax=Methylobacterium frigidaeris TaxID=2038277 RepID=A0AA37HH81_9HYPH|nr:PIN domain-containing protein [Methylobacterium frigidaeris]PIK69075.1 VapC toxin family PIN domain ribonuclease [Methylobacterium frigidaeris]GJD65509.1 Ribonuclease VapC1 [Methylobacterium frigidaeris]
MTSRYLLDMNVIIALRRRRPPSIVARLSSLQIGEAVMSPVTYGELCFGAAKSIDRDAAFAALARLVAAVPIEIAEPEETGRRYGAIRAMLGRHGQIIGGNDLWIAAHALASNLTLVTGNVGEFSRVPGLVIEDWTAQ